MSPSKLAVQVGHGTDFIHQKSLFNYTTDQGRKYQMWYGQWMGEFNRRKIVVGVKSEEKLKNIVKALQENDIRFSEIWDAGYTELDGETLTGLVIHPVDEDILPKSVKRLRLL